MERTELITVLGVSEHPTTGEVRRARRTVARLLHPDADASAATAMADVNAACDDWLAEIRSRRDVQTLTDRASERQPRPPSSNLDAGQTRPVRHTDWLLIVATSLVLLCVVIGVVVAVAGPSFPTIAAGLLLGMGAAGLYVVVSLLYGERRKR